MSPTTSFLRTTVLASHDVETLSGIRPWLLAVLVIVASLLVGANVRGRGDA